MVSVLGDGCFVIGSISLLNLNRGTVQPLMRLVNGRQQRRQFRAELLCTLAACPVIPDAEAALVRIGLNVERRHVVIGEQRFDLACLLQMIDLSLNDLTANGLAFDHLGGVPDNLADPADRPPADPDGDGNQDTESKAKLPEQARVSP